MAPKPSDAPSGTGSNQTPWYQNPVALAGYGAQVLGALMVIASFLLTNNSGLPPWVVQLCGAVLAVGSYFGLAHHSAVAYKAEMENQPGTKVVAIQKETPPIS